MNNKESLAEIKIDSLSREESRELLEIIRSEVDEIDIEITELLNRRAQKSELIGRLKQMIGLANYSPAREKEIINNLLKLASPELGTSTLLRIFERIIDESRAIQKRVRD